MSKTKVVRVNWLVGDLIELMANKISCNSNIRKEASA